MCISRRQPPHQKSFLLLLWEQLRDFIIIVLLVAAIVSLGIQDWESAGVLVRTTGRGAWAGMGGHASS